jgi:UDP-2,3-diacylglucosamine pyrophosphatase LpxH
MVLGQPMTLSIPPDASNYLLFSDVHLGADLVQHARPWTASRLQQAHRIDHDLGAMLDHYRQQADGARPWCLVIAGDFLDLVGMSISPSAGATLNAPLTDDELIHGLGSAQDHAAMKMRAVAVRHDLLFRRLAAFVEAGHSLVFVRGNHDVELYWESVQRAFVQALVERVERTAVEPADAAAVQAVFESRVEFRHWFFYVRGFLYVEHGHQYDAACAYHHVLAPRSPRDPSRISYSFSDILVRYVVRPTRELSVDGHEHNSVFDYLRFGFSLGLHGCARLGYRYLSAVGRMVGAWRDHWSEQAKKVRAEHDESMQKLARVGRLRFENLLAITKLWPVPVTGRLFAIFRTVFLDGLAAAALSGVIITLLSALGVLPLQWASVDMGTVMLGIFLYMKSCRVLEPHAALRRGAEQLKEFLPARYIVMGHTHKPVMDRLCADSTYVNLGHWSDDLLSDNPKPSPCSHLVIRHGAGGRSEATLCAWDSELGPRVLASDAVAAAAPAVAGGSPLAAQVTAMSRPT